MKGNELQVSLVHTLEDFQADLEKYLDANLHGAVCEVLLCATVGFYVKSLLIKVNNHQSNRVAYLTNEKRALNCVSCDISVVQKYFERFKGQTSSSDSIIDKEILFFKAVYEIMLVAATSSGVDLSNSISLICK